MIFRFTLTHTVLGSQEISEPDGWKDSILRLERDPEFHSLVEYFQGSFIFYGNNGVDNGGYDLLKRIDQIYGPDEEIIFLVEVAPDNDNFEHVFEGQVDLWEAVWMKDRKVQAPVIRNGFWANFINRKEIPVNLQDEEDIDGNEAEVFDSINLSLPAQIIDKTSTWSGTETLQDGGGAGNKFYVIPVGLPSILSEIEESYDLPFFPFTDVADVINIIEAFERGPITITLEGGMYARSLISGLGQVSQVQVQIFAKLNNGSSILLASQTDSGLSTQDYENTFIFSSTQHVFNDIIPTDLIYIYMTWNVDVNGSDGGDTHTFTLGLIDFTVTAFQKSFFATTNSQSFLLHDVGAHICDRIIGQPESFYSEYLGSSQTLARQYDDDGCAWTYALAKGLQIRQYTLLEKPFFLAFMDWWNGANPILNLGLGYEESGLINDQLIPNADFENDSSWENSGTGEDWIITGGNAVSSVTTGGTKFFIVGLSSNVEGGNFIYSIFFSMTNISGDSANINITFLDVDSNVVFTTGLSTGSNLNNQELSGNFTGAAVRFVRFNCNVLSGSGVNFSVHSFTLHGLISSEIIRVEKKEYFYDDSVTSVNFDNVRDITRTYDKDHIFNKITVGYQKWESENISGIDDPQGKRTYATVLKKAAGQDSSGNSTGTKNLYSEFIAASLAIETTRRTTREKSADYKFDNDTFIIAIQPNPVDISPETSPDVTDFEPELDENFDSITGLLNEETRYNTRITPARNLLRWLNYLSGCLQNHLSSPIKFQSGDGNYDMISEMDPSDCDENFGGEPLAENDNIPVSEEYLFLPIEHQITLPMTWDEYHTIQSNRRNPIGISQTAADHVQFFIKSLEYNIVKGTATISAWPKTYFSIEVIQNTFQMPTCLPGDESGDDCTDGITDEFGELITDEFGECITA